MKPLLYTAAIVCCFGAIGLLTRFSQLWKRAPSVRSMVANEENQARFLLGGAALIAVAAAMVWFA
jgi:hypothetical protein